jgi:isopenicillin-N N-acyltransferase-like protein
VLPFLAVSGSPAAQGRAHGTALAAGVHHNIAVYFGRFAREAGLEAPVVRERAALLAARLDQLHPEYSAGIAGIAAGSGADLVDVAALNFRYELIYSALAARELVDGCTAFALAGSATADGHWLMGQNWDWIPEVAGAVVRAEAPNGDVLGFTEAGIFGLKIGLAATGIGLAINGMMSVADSWDGAGLPFHARCHDALRAPSLRAAAAAIADGERACSANFVIAQSGRGIVNIEAAPGGTCAVAPSDGRLVHANHFEHAAAMSVVEAPYERRPISVRRQRRLADLIAAPEKPGVAELQQRLRDHDGYPDSVCRHPSQNEPLTRPYKTVVSVVMDLDDRALWISDGPPCEAPYQLHRLT